MFGIFRGHLRLGGRKTSDISSNGARIPQLVCTNALLKALKEKKLETRLYRFVLLKVTLTALLVQAVSH